jgi:hypothetical protein
MEWGSSYIDPITGMVTESVDPITGVPLEAPGSVNPSVNISDPSPGNHPGFIDKLETFGSSVVQGGENLVSDAFHGLVKGYGEVYHGIGQVVDYSEKKVENIVGFASSQVIWIALGLGVALYIATKTGNLKLTGVV